MVIDAGRICVGFDCVLDFFFGVVGMLYSARNVLYPSSRALTYNKIKAVALPSCYNERGSYACKHTSIELFLDVETDRAARRDAA